MVDAISKLLAVKVVGFRLRFKMREHQQNVVPESDRDPGMCDALASESIIQMLDSV